MPEEKDTYLTLQQASEGFYKEKGSKFIARAYPITQEEDVKNILQALRKEYYDARHHCYAYTLGFQQENYRANDDGEPNNSAGLPILRQIRSKDLTNTLIVVIRYFGGTKLGVSGLMQAYKIAAADALEQGEIVEKIIQNTLKIQFEYPQMNEVMKVVKEFDLEIASQEMYLKCEMSLWIRKNLWELITEKFANIEGLEIVSKNT